MHTHGPRPILIGMLALLLVSFLPGTYAEEELNCFICHKHRGLSRIDEEGSLRLFYINQELYNSGPHRRNACKDCHSDVKQMPHDTVAKIDCAMECHIGEPSSNKSFSHENIQTILERSVHSRYDENGDLKPYQDDYPECKDCHEEPFYRPFSMFKGVKIPGISDRAISRCKTCHVSGNFAEDFYEHVTTRLHKTRLPMETIKICAKCHEDPELIERHGLHDAVKTYMETFHGKMVFLGGERTPDCIDCHVVVGQNSHLIESHETETASTHASNVGNTCRHSDCHTGASTNLAQYRTHVTYQREEYPMEFYMIVFFKGMMAAVMYFFLTLIFLELLRRLFPKFSFFKDKGKDPAGGSDSHQGLPVQTGGGA